MLYAEIKARFIVLSKYGNNRVLSSVYNGRSAADPLSYYIM